MKLSEAYREICADFAAGGSAHNSPVPGAEHTEANASGIEYLVYADGNGVNGHVLYGTAQIADGVCGAGLGAYFENAGGESGKFLNGKLTLSFVEGKMTVNADAALGSGKIR